jgi:hypothetical protein
MPERLDRISVTTSRGTVPLPWNSREALLAEIDHLASAAGIVKAFTDVGASRPVTLGDDDRALLLELLKALVAQGGCRRAADGLVGSSLRARGGSVGVGLRERSTPPADHGSAARRLDAGGACAGE